jgi:hypothetical protein
MRVPKVIPSSKSVGSSRKSMPKDGNLELQDLNIKNQIRFSVKQEGESPNRINSDMQQEEEIKSSSSFNRSNNNFIENSPEFKKVPLRATSQFGSKIIEEEKGAF